MPAATQSRLNSGDGKLNTAPMPSLRTLLVLGRVSNLPTVWSNCLAGWWLGGGGNQARLPFLFLGATCLYLGGMFLNDAFDADFDRQHRKERPIPTGAISSALVWRIGFALLLLGNALLFGASLTAGILGAVLALTILLYDAVHKAVTLSPLLMGACRFWVYAIAAATGVDGVTGWALWGGVALAAYVTGLSCVARVESTRGTLDYWPLALLAAPIGLAFVMNTGPFLQPALLVSLMLTFWALRSLRPILWSTPPQPGRAVAGLLAGIVFVDWIAAAHAPRELGWLFLGLFLLALLGQRYVPAT
jgi:4-hydroxybenzoate polyprenyltransferase